uniref:Acid-sensing ion channel 1-like n=1 Tax=Panagrellus redivivus TaxID=6233 RepID=A0A7E4WBM7_PANRE
MSASTVRNRRSGVAKDHIHAFPEWTSTHGISQIGRSRHWYCLGFWGIVTFVAFALLVWQIVILIIKYYRYDVSVNIELKFEQRTFPAVTVCDLNPYHMSVVKNYPKVVRLMNTYDYAVNKIACTQDTTCTINYNATLDGYLNLYGLGDMNDTTALQTEVLKLLTLEMAAYDKESASVTFDDFIQGCSFNTEDCGINDWTIFMDPVMGRCFMFNGDGNYSSNRAGPIYGLRLALKTNVSEFMPFHDTAGMRVLVHDQAEYPFPDVFGYLVAVGASTDLGISYTAITRLGLPYSNCTDKKPSGYLYELDYSTEGCQRSRYQSSIITSCNCYNPTYPTLNSSEVPVCTVDENFSCWVNENNSTLSDNSCTQPCNEGVYTVTVSSAKWPSGAVSAVGKCADGDYYNTTCLEVFKNNGAFLEVFYAKLNYESMSESAAYTLTSLLSDFGGQIGLWLGMSVVSVIEFCVLIFQLVSTGISSRFGKATTF